GCGGNSGLSPTLPAPYCGSIAVTRSGGIAVFSGPPIGDWLRGAGRPEAGGVTAAVSTGARACSTIDALGTPMLRGSGNAVSPGRLTGPPSGPAVGTGAGATSGACKSRNRSVPDSAVLSID